MMGGIESEDLGVVRLKCVSFYL